MKDTRICNIVDIHIWIDTHFLKIHNETFSRARRRYHRPDYEGIFCMYVHTYECGRFMAYLVMLYHALSPVVPGPGQVVLIYVRWHGLARLSAYPARPPGGRGIIVLYKRGAHHTTPFFATLLYITTTQPADLATGLF